MANPLMDDTRDNDDDDDDDYTASVPESHILNVFYAAKNILL